MRTLEPMNNSTITKGFIAAGLSNLVGVPLFSKVFTNEVLLQADPPVMGIFGLIMIMVWGVAFIAVSKKFENLKWLVGVFMLEKLSYVIAAIHWNLNNSLSDLYSQDALSGIFFGIYGINDFIFLLFFGYVFIKISK